jgi:hypothetical protein
LVQQVVLKVWRLRIWASQMWSHSPVSMYHCFRGTCCLHLQRSGQRQDLPPEHWHLPLGTDNFKQEACMFYVWNQHTHNTLYTTLQIPSLLHTLKEYSTPSYTKHINISYNFISIIHSHHSNIGSNIYMSDAVKPNTIMCMQLKFYLFGILL